MQIVAGSPAGCPDGSTWHTTAEGPKSECPLRGWTLSDGAAAAARAAIQQQHVNWPEFSGAEDAPG